MALTATSPNWSLRCPAGTGDQSVIYSLAGSTYALNRLAFYEHSDDPNHIEIWKWNSSATISPAIPARAMAACMSAARRRILGTKEILAAGDDHYITAIQVCTTDENDVRKRKIKGARDLDGKARSGGHCQPH